MPPDVPESGDRPAEGKVRRKRRIPWFGLFVSLFIIGGIASISVPCLLSANQRSKQKRTMATLQRLGGAVDAYIEEHGAAPAAESMDALLPMLDRRRVGSESGRDGWGTGLRYQIQLEKPGGYVLWSAAKDQSFDRPEALPPVKDFTRYFDCDIIWASGSFVQSPEGVQRS